ncbi:IS110 family transposase [Oxalobacter vibrioformis]|uniref:IS110 family transposase n=1 Tax=Oxalobacter vibrioformis TaxID=933080 RepID=A0A9E9P2Y2_9BURK|nr:IS110 family transposase [Oxalobacter vibrioformis]WAW10407.1 IS110 family transposase [Oxalobacter vibrioformis]
MENRNVIGLDLAKNIFQVHIADSRGKKVKTMRLRRNQLITTLGMQSPALIGVEASGGAHHWARELQKLGHEIKIMAPQHVKPYVKGNKTDARDAEAICEAAARPAVPKIRVRNVDQQQIQALHRTRELWMKQRIATSNQARGLLTEFGYIFPVSYRKLLNDIPVWQGQPDNPGILQQLIEELYQQLLHLDQKIQHIEARLKAFLKEDPKIRLIESIPGIGLLTATAFIASFGDASSYSSGRKLASAIGLTPREYSSGEKRVRMGISRRVNPYLRSLLVHGARAVLINRKKKPENDWIEQLVARRGYNVATVALAAKNVRRIWGILQSGEVYDPDHEIKRELQSA